jgi:acyl-CoA synthetase (NDP forming)
MSIRNLEYLFKPRSIALIGASDKPASVGGVLTRNLTKAGFDGPVALAAGTRACRDRHAALYGAGTDR